MSDDDGAATEKPGTSLRPLASALKERSSEHIAEVRRGLADIRHAPAVVRPPRGAPLRRFLYGFGLPLRIARALFADPVARRHYLRVIFTQLFVVLLICALATYLGRAGGAWRGGDHHLSTLFAFVSAFYAGLGVVEWLVVALSRDYHDQLGRRASLLSGAPPEDPEKKPRIRVDVRWLGRKLKRKVRGILVIAAGLPAVLALSLIPFAGKYLYPLVALAWTTYWVGVFTASKSAFAWRSEGAPGAPEPWFMRGAARATKDNFLGRWGITRLYLVVWRNLSSGVFPPAREFEEHPYELLGIAAFRTLLALPGTYLFFRPIMPVASAHVLCTPMASDDEGRPADVSEPATVVEPAPLLTESVRAVPATAEAPTEASQEPVRQRR